MMPGNGASTERFTPKRWVAIAVCALACRVMADGIPMTLEDFHLSGTQIGDVDGGVLSTSGDCAGCHGFVEPQNMPYDTWKGSLMANAGLDPLFFAQLATANQDVENVGYFCLRCHVPMSFVTGHAYDADGSTLDEVDRDGVTCHLCHSMVDPIYKPGESPAEDVAILENLAEVPQYYGNAMFVLDPNGLRRGPYEDAQPPHDAVYSPFVKSSDICGTCHDVGNVAISRQEDGTYWYNDIDASVPDENLHAQFPLERTYTEWKLSSFADGGVDMGGRFGGSGDPVVSTCQDCHMPKTTGLGCYFGPEREDLAKHDFAGATAWVLEIIALYYADDPEIDIDLEALEAGRQKAIDMLQLAASLEVYQECGTLLARVTNETGHKIPTGHIEGRRIWTNVKFRDEFNQIVKEYGRYDYDDAELDEETTDVYEMHVGLSEDAAALTGLPAGTTTHMALADIITKDTRIPPRGFDNSSYEAAGAPVVGTAYADDQYWDDTTFWIPQEAKTVEVTVNYQTVTRHYIEALRDGNVTDHWGDTLYQLWLDTDKAPPIPMTTMSMALMPFLRGDFNGDSNVDLLDYDYFQICVSGPDGAAAEGCGCADVDADGDIDLRDFRELLLVWEMP